MICREVGNLLHGYLDRELDLSRSLEIEDHLSTCPACSLEYGQHLALRSAIHRSSLYHEAPAELMRRLRPELRREHRARKGSRGLPARLRSFWVPLGVAALIVLVALPFVMRPSAESLLAQQVLSAHIRSLMPGHLMDVPSADQHTVKPWFDGRLDFSPPVIDLSSQGFPLIGGRLDYVDDRPVASVVYQRRKHVINVFIWPSADSGRAPGKAIAMHGYSMITWTQSGMAFWAVSDVNTGDLQEFIRLLRR